MKDKFQSLSEMKDKDKSITKQDIYDEIVDMTYELRLQRESS